MDAPADSNLQAGAEMDAVERQSTDITALSDTTFAGGVLESSGQMTGL
jgi:hypothetical protein